jgi:hypothetical protein
VRGWRLQQREAAGACFPASQSALHGAVQVIRPRPLPLKLQLGNRYFEEKRDGCKHPQAVTSTLQVSIELLYGSAHWNARAIATI